jgi:hypothetical protein
VRLILNDLLGKRYPHRFNDREGHYRSAGHPLYEAPLRYPQRAYTNNQQHQNARGIYNSLSDGQVSPNFDRVVFNGRGELEGISYHPYGDPSGFKRAHSILSNGTVRYH